MSKSGPVKKCRNKAKKKTREDYTDIEVKKDRKTSQLLLFHYVLAREKK